MKNWIIIFTFTLSTLLGRKVTVKLATLAPEGTHVHSMLLEIGQEWRNLTKGKVRMKIYAGGIVGDERDMVRKIRIGQIHGAAITTEGMTEVNQFFTAFNYPLLFQDYDDVDFVRNQLNSELYDESEKNGFKLLAMVDIGWVYWFSTDPVYTPSDLKKTKIWTWAGDYKTAKLWDEAGFNPIPLAVPDVHSSLQTGLVNAMPFPPLYVAANQYFGITKNMLNMKWGILTAALVIDLKVWNRIKPKYQKVMTKVSEEIGLEYQLNNRKDEDEAVNVMKNYGLQVNDLTKEQINEWNVLVESMYPLIRGNIVQKEIFDRVIKLKDKMPSRLK